MEALDSFGEPDLNYVEEEPVHYASGPSSKLQPWFGKSILQSISHIFEIVTRSDMHACFRAVVSKARWNDEMGMAQVVVQKGTFSKSTGIVPNGNLYYSIEDLLYFIEIGALILVDETDTLLSLEHFYMMMSCGKYKCCWEEFRAYRQLKSLGYTVGRHGIPWSMKKVKSDYESNSLQGFPECDEVVNLESEEIKTVIGLLDKMQINVARPVYDVYLPNSKFRKSSPGDPSFVLCFTRGHTPSRVELEVLEGHCGAFP